MEPACRELLRLNASTAQVGERRISALHTACGAENYWMARHLIQLDGQRDINSRDCNNQTPLMWAIIRDWSDPPRRYLTHQTKRTNWDGMTQNHLKQIRAGYYSLAESPSNWEIITFLLDNGASIDAIDYQKRNALHWAATMGTTDIVSALLGRGADVDAVDENRQTALHLAVIHGAVECMKVLLAAGANPNAMVTASTTGSIHASLKKLESQTRYRVQKMPLHLAFEEPDQHRLCEMVQLLLEAGANIFGRDFNGETCLHIAAKGGNTAAVQELICSNFYGNMYLSIKDNDGRSARDCAEQMGHKKVAELLETAESENPLGIRSRAKSVIA